MRRFSFTACSSNIKTGKIPVTMTDRESCPTSCPFMGKGCYAENFPLSLHWTKVAETGLGQEELFKKISALPEGQLWRHNVAGDLPAIDGTIDRNFVSDMVDANDGKKGFTYTHHEQTPENLTAIRFANLRGFTVNVSALDIDNASEVHKMGLPAVVVVKRGTDPMFKHNDVLFQQCPATIHESATCENCGLCQIANRRVVVTFPAHGARTKAIEAVL